MTAVPIIETRAHLLQVTRLPQLMVLELSGNQLTRIDDNVGGMTMLKELDLSGNMLSQLSEALGTLPKLEVRACDDCSIRSWNQLG